MERRRTYGIMGGVVLTLALVSVISITYATFNRELNVNGSGTVNKQSWDVHFKTDSIQMTKTGTAKQISAPTISTANGIASTAIGDYSVTFSTPGDSITYTFTVENKGTFNAKLVSATIPTPTVRGSGANPTTDAANVKNHLHYTLTYNDGTALNPGTDVLSALNGTATFKLTLSYDNSIAADELPKNDVTISGLAFAINYQQS